MSIKEIAHGRQFMTLKEIEELLSISNSQAYSLVRSGALRAIRIGGRGQWRVEVDELDKYIANSYYNPPEGGGSDNLHTDASPVSQA